MGKGRTTINQPPAIDPGQAMGEYLFGEDFTNYSGVTDPQLQNRLLAAEAQFRPLYTGLELADQEAALFGIQGREAGEGYQAQKDRVASLQAQLSELDPEITETTKGFRGTKGKTTTKDNPQYLELKRQLDLEQGKLKELAPITAQEGLLGMQGRAAEIAGQQDTAQKAREMAQLEQFGGQFTDAVRAADPESFEAAQATRSLADTFAEDRAGVMGAVGDIEDFTARAETAFDEDIAGFRQDREEFKSLQKDFQAEADKLGANVENLDPRVDMLSQLSADEAQRLASEASVDDPRLTKLQALQQKQAETLYEESEGRLSPERAREAEQAARMAGASRGRVGDAGTLAQELLGRESSRSALRSEARTAGGLAADQQGMIASQRSQRARDAMNAGQLGFGMQQSAEAMRQGRRGQAMQMAGLGLQAGQQGMQAGSQAMQGTQAGLSAGMQGRQMGLQGRRLGSQLGQAQQGALGQAFNQFRATAGDPTAFLFGRPSLSGSLGTQSYNQAFNLAAQQQGPQLFDPNMGLNMAMQQRSQDMNLLGAQAQANAANNAGAMGMFGSVLGGYLGGLG